MSAAKPVAGAGPSSAAAMGLAGASGWSPTPPASPHPQASMKPPPSGGWGVQPPQSQASGSWNTPTPAVIGSVPGSAWNAPAKPVDEESMWNAAPGFASANATPSFGGGALRRPRANSDLTWGNTLPVGSQPGWANSSFDRPSFDAVGQRPGEDGWDSVPGWSTRPGAAAAVAPPPPAPASGWGAAPPVTPVARGGPAPPAASGWTPPDNLRQRAEQWSASSTSPQGSWSQQREGWAPPAPTGWDPLPPPRSNSSTSISALGSTSSPGTNINAPVKWDGKRPTASSTVPSVVASAGFGDRSVSFDVGDGGFGGYEQQQQPTRQTRSRGNSISSNNNVPYSVATSGTAYMNPPANPPPQLAMAASNNYANPPPAASLQKSSSLLRKARSTSGLDRKYQSEGPTAPTGSNGYGPRTGALGANVGGFGLVGPSGGYGSAAALGGFPGSMQIRKDSVGLGKKDDKGNDELSKDAKSAGRYVTRQTDDGNPLAGAPAQATADAMRRAKPSAYGAPVVKEPTKAIGVYIYGFPKWVRVREIIEIFTKYGTIVNVGIVSKPKRQERAYAYVDYETPGSAAKAVEAIKTKTYFEMTKPLDLRLHFESHSIEEDDDDEEFVQTSSVSAVPPSGAPVGQTSYAPAAAAAPFSQQQQQQKRPTDSFGAAAAGAPSLAKKEAPKKDAAKQEKDEGAMDYKTLHIGNVPQTVDKSELEKVFSAYGDLKRIHVVQRPKEKRAFAFVSYREESSAKKALTAIRETRFFDMSENLKAEYSKQQPATTATATASDTAKRPGTVGAAVTAAAAAGGAAKGVDGKWKKGDPVKKVEPSAPASKKKEKEKEKTPAGAAAAAAPKQSKKTANANARSVIFISQASALTVEEIKTKFGEHGVVKAHYFVQRASDVPVAPITDGDATPAAVSSAKFALVVFDKPEDAAKAVAVKVLNGVFPRQRRVVVRGFPASASEADIRSWVATAGEVRKVEVFVPTAGEKKEGDSAPATPQPAASAKPTDQNTWWLVEFVRPDGAARSLVKCVEETLPSGTKVHAEYAPSATRPAKKSATGGAGKDGDGAFEAAEAEAAAQDEAEAAELAAQEEDEEEDDEGATSASDDEKLAAAEIAAAIKADKGV